MEEILLKNKKHGMRTLLLGLLVELLALAGLICGAVMMETADSTIGAVLFVAGLVLLCVGWLPLIGLRVLKPNYALVLTLFGIYVGTI